MAFHLGVYPAHSKRFSIALPVLTPRCRLPGASEEGKVKITLITAVLLAFGGGAHAGGRIQVFVNPNGAPLDVTGIAEGISSRMFAAAGVEGQWHMLRAGSRNAVPPGRAIIIDFENKARFESRHDGLCAAVRRRPHRGLLRPDQVRESR